jgi:hypothetical protein
MAKSWFRFTMQEEGAHNGTHTNGAAVPEVAEHPDTDESLAGLDSLAKSQSDAGVYQSFEDIYLNSAVKMPRVPYGILKVSVMANSPHLSGMSSATKRCALLMALEAANAGIEDVLQDAVVRQRALNDYEEAKQQELQRFEAAKAEENTRIQAELERLTAEYMARIQGNLNEVAQAQDQFRGWQKGKQQEAQRIAEAAALCVPQGTSTNGAGLTAVLERASLARK